MSIIIPVYNVEQYLERSILSVINQTYNNIEIILVDDGSTDNSGKICDEYEKIDNRIKVFHKLNGGLGSARNFGYEKSLGEYILYLDSDDYIENVTIEKMMQYSDFDIVCCGFDRVDEDTKKIYSKEMIEMPFDELTINNKNINEAAFLNPAGWGKLFKRKILQNVRFSDNKNSIEDILFYLEIIPKISKVKYIKEILWHYMIKKDSLISSLTQEKADLFEVELLNIKEKYQNLNYNEYIYNYLTLEVFIHNCISIPSRLYANKDIDVNARLKHIKGYMNDNFPGWKKIKINIKGRYIKRLAIHLLIMMYRMNIFIVFLCIYNFMIDKLRIDIKW